MKLVNEDSQDLLRKLMSALERKGHLTDELLRDRMAVADTGKPENGARMIALAWSDPDYKMRLMADGRKAAEEVGVFVPWAPPLGVLECTDSVHYMIVCTLCSCYPRWLLGYPRDWYKSPTYRARAVREPRKLLEEWGQSLPADVVIKVVDSTADFRWIVLPKRPAGTEGWSVEQLAALVTADVMVGAELLPERI